jgi:hypothetical protein
MLSVRMDQAHMSGSMARRQILGRDFCVFGEICVQSNRKSHKEKLKNRGDVGIFVGYQEDH